MLPLPSPPIVQLLIVLPRQFVILAPPCQAVQEQQSLMLCLPIARAASLCQGVLEHSMFLNRQKRPGTNVIRPNLDQWHLAILSLP